jgi:hypothetical protein
MSSTIETITSSACKSIKSRYVIGLGGVALAAGLILGGSVLKTSGATPQPQPMFAHAADAENAGRTLGTAQPIFANAADAEDAGRAVALGATTMAVQPMFGTAADAEYAARGLVVVPEPIHLPSVVMPMFANADDAYQAGRNLVQVPELARPFVGQPTFSTEADAEFAARALVPDAALR